MNVNNPQKLGSVISAERPTAVGGRVDLTKYIVVPVWFGCNNDCRICMLSGIRQKLPAMSLDLFRRLLLGIRDEGRFRNLILSGAEVTSFEGFLDFVEFARSLNWFTKIQIQTNGRRLSDRDYLSKLIAAGVNEFFISIHGLGELNDFVTRRPGSFRDIMGALDNLEMFPVNVISNTVLTSINYGSLAALMTFLAGRKISEHHLWNFFPMRRKDAGDLIVGLGDFVQILPSLQSIFTEAGRPLVLKSFPECTVRRSPLIHDSFFPVTVLPDKFWQEFSESGFGFCPYRHDCDARQCWGLSGAYLEKYGDERESLKPFKY